jgi:hypothetical protein
MKKIAIIQALCMAIPAPIFLYFSAQQQLISFLIGSFLILLDVALMGLGYGLIFKKKLVALAIGIIVFKYAILGIIIFQLVKQPWLSSLWFCLGIATFAITAMVYAISEALTEGRNHVI